MTTVIDVLLSGSLADAPTTATDLVSGGAAGLFTYEGASDVFFPLVGAAAALPDPTVAPDAKVYTNIAVAFPRSPMHLAYAAWDLQRLSQGRFALGLGSQIKAHVERRFGSTWDKPLAQMRETITAVHAIFESWQHGTPLDFVGEYTQHTLMPPTLTPQPLSTAPPPVWLAALGPRMTQLAGEVADGLLVHPFTTAQHIDEHTMPNLVKGLDRGERDRADVTVTVGAIVGLHDGSDDSMASAERIVRGTLGFYGSTPAYRPVLDTHGWGDLQPELRRLTKEGRWDQLGHQYDDEQMAALAVMGTPEEVGTDLATRFGNQPDRLALSLPQGVDPQALRRLVDAFHAAQR